MTTHHPRTGGPVEAASHFSFSAIPRAVTLIVEASSAEEAMESAALLEDSDFGLSDLARAGFRIDQLGFGDPEIGDVEPCESGVHESVLAPQVLTWAERLNRAGTSGQLADVTNDDAVGALHQFLDRASEVFRESGDESRAASFAEHAEALRLMGDEIHYLAQDLRASPCTARAAAANIATIRADAAAPAAKPAYSAVPPPHPPRSR